MTHMRFGTGKSGYVRGPSRREMPHVRSVAGSAMSGPTVEGWGNYASWLSDDILLIVGWFHAEGERSPKTSLILNGDPVPLEARCLSYPRPDLPDGDPRAGKVITVRFLRPDDARGSLGSLMVNTDSATFALGPVELSHAIVGLQTLVRGGLAWLDPERRAEVMEFLVSTLTEHPQTTNSLLLSKNLFFVCEPLRTVLSDRQSVV